MQWTSWRFGTSSCAGITAAAAALADHPSGALGHWLDSIEQVYETYRDEMDRLADPTARTRRLCELNVVEQVQNVGQTTTVRGAWRRNQPLTPHGWVYDLHDGLLNEICDPVSDVD